ncbi:TetR/AcrR family transcriptional regulator [Marinobacter lacisalsi]|uniref:TetR/AcrR family transcriptional regulator n=1 Tax=Marinobacter lacisalsi TaxID=475979 RepID=A0ABV8QLA9_9GAMM
MNNKKTDKHAIRKLPEELVEAPVDGIQNTSLVEQRRDQICDAALELFLQKGFASTTIRDICARSGVNQASIYDYIANKNDILRRLLNKLWFRSGAPNLDELLENQPESATFEQLVALYLTESWSKKRKGTLLAYRTVPHLQKADRKAMRRRDEMVIHALADKLRIRTALPADDYRVDVIANLIIYLAGFGPMRDWLHQDLTQEQIVSAVAAGVNAMVEQLASSNTEGASST